MKYLKENFEEFVEDEKMMEYFKSLIGKFVIFTYRSSDLNLAEFTNVYFKDDDYFVSGLTDKKFPFKSAFMRHINVKSVYDTYEDAFEDYELMTNANKYNL